MNQDILHLPTALSFPDLTWATAAVFNTSLLVNDF